MRPAAYMEMIYIDTGGDARKTNVGAEMETSAETRAAFKSYRHLEVASDRARFLLDLYSARGDLVDTILLDEGGFRVISNEPVLTDAEYRKIDDDYWAAAQKRAA